MSELSVSFVSFVSFLLNDVGEMHVKYRGLVGNELTKLTKLTSNPRKGM
jgi:hypothetical protein